MSTRVNARRRRGPQSEAAPPSDLLAHRCRMLTRKGRLRQAAQALRELASRDQLPAAWVRLGAMLARCERTDAAVDALRQGWWLHRQTGQTRRADVVAKLIDQVRAGAFPNAA